MTPTLIALIAVAVLVIITLVKGAVIVPQKSAFIIERLGKFDRTLEAGFHILIPFVDRAAYVFSLKEQVVDIPAQICITKDNFTLNKRLIRGHQDCIGQVRFFEQADVFYRFFRQN